ncbi:MAG: VWA domain-containing protein [Desulfobacterales bacterium]|nr:VWA domain-containing protein [Desulfobacteraceae bacterium]MBT7086063.1 VWA domain-containing protein [Desulfobacterales bacterium]
MKKEHKKSIILTLLLILVTFIAMAYSKNKDIVIPDQVQKDIVKLTGNLSQNKIVTGGNGRVNLSLTLRAKDIINKNTCDIQNVDMVIVLDQSGSMGGKKISDARRAVLNLLSSLTARDRFAIVCYSNSAYRLSSLTYVTGPNREHLESLVRSISTGGGTNLGAGLEEGMRILTRGTKNTNQRKLVLISDGLANQGITNIHTLGDIAARAVKDEFSISTAGVGNDFNEQLMALIADRGTGNYYYIENPEAFAEVFSKEYQETRNIAAASIEIRIPLLKGMHLTDASGYPIKVKGNNAVFYPGNLLSGQSRKLFLTIEVPADKEGSFEIKGINAVYKHEDKKYSSVLSDRFIITQVKSKKEAMASIDKDEWEDRVLKNDFNMLRENIAADIRGGKRNDALKRINDYKVKQESINSQVGSGAVSDNLEKELTKVLKTVKDTFTGDSPSVALKQKKNAKVMQYEGYKGKRGRK